MSMSAHNLLIRIIILFYAWLVAGKVKVGDTILTISGNDTRKLTFKQVKSLLIGPVGTSGLAPSS
jgi:hypothetical protein